MTALASLIAKGVGRWAWKPQWYAFDVLSHNRIGPFWSKTKASDIASDLQEHLMFMDTCAREDQTRWITVNERWMKLVGVL